MPELPDLEVFLKEARKALNHKVKSVEISDKKFIKESKTSIENHLKNKKLIEAFRKGKYLMVKEEKNGGIIMHFGMTGYLSYDEQKEEVPKYARIIFGLDNDHRLIYFSKRKLGSLETTSDLNKHLENLGLGTDALEIKKKDFTSIVQNSRSMIKSLLMDQSQISGIGNVYSDEILFQAKIHPHKRANELEEKQINELYEKTSSVLKTAIKKDAEREKMPDNFLINNRKEGDNCPACKGKIEKIKTTGRTGYFCPACQKLK